MGLKIGVDPHGSENWWSPDVWTAPKSMPTH